MSVTFADEYIRCFSLKAFLKSLLSTPAARRVSIRAARRALSLTYGVDGEVGSKAALGGLGEQGIGGIVGDIRPTGAVPPTAAPRILPRRVLLFIMLLALLEGCVLEGSSG